jgi:hypothetical protein
MVNVEGNRDFVDTLHSVNKDNVDLYSVGKQHKGHVWPSIIAVDPTCWNSLVARGGSKP